MGVERTGDVRGGITAGGRTWGYNGRGVYVGV